jgi:hypothetical protein
MLWQTLRVLMETPPFRPTKIQIAGSLVAIALSVATWLLGSSAVESLMIGLLVTLLSVAVDIHQCLTTGGLSVLRVMRENQALKGYEPCIHSYPAIINKFKYNTSPPLGFLLARWIDEKIGDHHADININLANGRIDFNLNEVEERSVQLQKTIKIGGFATQLEINTEFWEGASSYLRTTQEVVRNKGVTITRVFILKSEKSLRTKEIADQIRLDRAAGIETFLAFTSGPNKITNQRAIQDFGIWDDSLLCVINLNAQTAHVTGSTYSIANADLEEAKKWKSHILRHAVSTDMYHEILHHDTMLGGDETRAKGEESNPPEDEKQV